MVAPAASTSIRIAADLAGQARHRLHVAADGDDPAGAGVGPQLAHGQREPRRRADQRRIVREREVRLRHADRQRRRGRRPRTAPPEPARPATARPRPRRTRASRRPRACARSDRRASRGTAARARARTPPRTTSSASSSAPSAAALEPLVDRDPGHVELAGEARASARSRPPMSPGKRLTAITHGSPNAWTIRRFAARFASPRRMSPLAVVAERLHGRDEDGRARRDPARRGRRCR